MSDAFTIYGIAVIPKTGGEPVDEWFPSRKQRDEFLAWYKSHDRKCAAISRPDQAAIDRAERLKAEEAHRLALAVARAGRSVFTSETNNSFYAGQPFYQEPANVGLGAGVGLALGVALGGLF